MKICSISALNFRTLENFNLRFKPNYCAISGKNNAGKSAIVKIIQFFFGDRDDDIYDGPLSGGISFTKDSTQWSKSEEMEVSVEVELDQVDDSEVFFVVNTYSPEPIKGDTIFVKISQQFYKDGTNRIICKVGEQDVDGQKASEILKKFRSASNLVVHNSTMPLRRIYYVGESFTEVMEAHFSPDDRKKILEAEKGLQTRVKKAAQQHKDELQKLLGRLNENLRVELSSIERSRSSRFPLEIKLTDKSVEVPLHDWGSGTQNRTRVLMSVLDALRFRSSVTAGDRSTPVFLVEEPESFLHPSAQAEFGQVLNALAEDLQIQIIATTHSPYMLNQNDPSANYLLERHIFRGLPRETQIKDTSGDDWMLPFAENLGIVPSEFRRWKSVFGVAANKVILVEGDIDKEYFEFIRDNYGKIYAIARDVEIVPYGGKDALKNTSILQFMINKFGKVFITYDLDVAQEIRPALERIGLIENRDFCPVGINSPGDDCIEGLIPASVKRKIYSEKHNLVSAMGSQDTKARNSAKNQLKKEFLTEFKRNPPGEAELKEFKSLFAVIAKTFM